MTEDLLGERAFLGGGRGGGAAGGWVAARVVCVAVPGGGGGLGRGGGAGVAGSEGGGGVGESGSESAVGDRGRSFLKDLEKDELREGRGDVFGLPLNIVVPRLLPFSIQRGKK